MYDHYLAKLAKELKGECLFSYSVFEKKRKKLCVLTKGNITSLSKGFLFFFCFTYRWRGLFCTRFWVFILLLNIYSTGCSFTGN